MFRFEHIEFLWLLVLLVPAVVLFIYWLQWKKRTIKRFGNPKLVAQLSPAQSTKMLVVKFILLSLAFVFLVLAIANPQIGTRTEKVKRSGIDVMIALDVSKSMLAEDIQPNRLAKAKNFISHFIDELKNDRLGMIIFAGRAYLQMPQTVDYSAAKMYLKTITPEQIPTQGTAIELAVHLAQEALSKSEAKSKAVILISDGEDNEEGGLDAIEEAAKKGIKVYTIAVGSEKGAPIPLANGDFKRDGNGNIVLSKVNMDVMRQYAMTGNGKAYLLNNSNDVVRAVLHDLGKLETKDFEEIVYTDFDNQFVWCLLISLLLLLVEFALFERKVFFNYLAP